ncbi:hypothetical protein AB4Y86_19395, partial [Arthrobacter sp. 2YAF22_2]|uniref:rhamnosyltransferase WsaF family glycosyltransferase n=1 Tax=Arthrobacter sp. 2YAF22_2 TaxID=3233029 RepID=UPI003F8EBDB8
GFAGLTTALRAGQLIAKQLGLSLRILVLKKRPIGYESIITDTSTFLKSIGLIASAGEPEVLYLDDFENSEASVDDHWVVTFWMTAYAVGRLVDRGSIAPRSVTYLIQDFEPGFYAFGTEYALAMSTYSLRFNWLVNSASLATFLSEQGFASSSRRRVFAPAIDTAKIEESALGWLPDSERIRVLFYGRPRHPRNLFDLGVEALRIWVSSAPAAVLERISICSIGGEHDPLELGKGIELRTLGKLSLADYYKQLSTTDVGVALMFSPHPSHLALEMPMAGIPTLTNSFHRARGAWLPKLRVHEATPEALAIGFGAVVSDATELDVHRFEKPPSPGLGQSLNDAISDMPLV